MFYKTYVFKIPDENRTIDEGDLVDVFNNYGHPHFHKGSIQFLFDRDNWTENPLIIRTPDKDYLGASEIDKYLMGSLEGKFFAWLSNRPLTWAESQEELSYK